MLRAKDKTGRTPAHFAACTAHNRVEACPGVGGVRLTTPHDVLPLNEQGRPFVSKWTFVFECEFLSRSGAHIWQVLINRRGWREPFLVIIHRAVWRCVLGCARWTDLALPLNTVMNVLILVPSLSNSVLFSATRCREREPVAQHA
jgi:hypothetical protein